MSQPVALVVMGVSGSGKTTVGKALAARLGWQFIDGDDLHPLRNVAKMRAGKPLDDDDRWPWLDAIAAQIDAWRAAGKSGVITCSALKRRYRERILGNRPRVRLIYLAGSRELIAQRLPGRKGHFMPASLLDSQFATLEPPGGDEHAVVAPIDRPVAGIVDLIVTSLSSREANMAEPT
jgi:carbohydrate kinase (thermoresistant glucokinase family)